MTSMKKAIPKLPRFSASPEDLNCSLTHSIGEICLRKFCKKCCARGTWRVCLLSHFYSQKIR